MSVQIVKPLGSVPSLERFSVPHSWKAHQYYKSQDLIDWGLTREHSSIPPISMMQTFSS